MHTYMAHISHVSNTGLFTSYIATLQDCFKVKKMLQLRNVQSSLNMYVHGNWYNVNDSMFLYAYIKLCMHVCIYLVH